jgi:uncharacterized protein (DUF2235 family)
MAEWTKVSAGHYRHAKGFEAKLSQRTAGHKDVWRLIGPQGNYLSVNEPTLDRCKLLVESFLQREAL